MHRRVSPLVFIAAVCCSACAPTLRSEAARPSAISATTPSPVDVAYATDPGGSGVVGGAPAEARARAVIETLRARGDDPRADRLLADLGNWYFREVGAGHHPTSAQSDQAAARLGFVGQLYAATVFPAASDDPRAWRDVVAALPRNAVVNRFGIWTSPDGQTAVVLFAAVEAKLEPFPRHVAVGASLRLRGALARRFTHGQVYLTAPDGVVGRTDLANRAVDVTLPLARAGIYRVELMGDGPSGPVVLSNVPVYVGVDEPLSEEASPNETVGAADAAQRMFTLLNEARRRAGLAPLTFEPQLAAVAVAYCHEMVNGHFFGHVSPTTGNVGDRVRRAGIFVSMVGENVSQGESAETAHQALMDSPGHRANMLDPRFTHVGIGVVATNAEPPLVATLVFVRRTDPSRLTAKEVTTAIATHRRQRGVPTVAVDSVLQAAAQAGTSAFAAGTAPSKEQAMNVAEAALVRADRGKGIVRASGCAEWIEIHELADLDDVALLSNPRMKSLGVGVAPRNDTAPPSLAVLVLVDGTNCK